MNKMKIFIKLLIIFLISFFCITNISLAQEIQLIDSGTYYVKSILKKDMVLDVLGASNASGANVELFEKNKTNCQKINVKYLGDGYYTFEFVHSLKALDVEGANTQDKTNVWQYEKNGTDAQKWKIIASGDGSYLIQTKLADKYLTVKNSNAKNFANIEIDSKKQDDSQKFMFEYVDIEQKKYPKTIENGSYYIKSLEDSKVISPQDNLTSLKTNVELSEKNDLDFQKINVKYGYDGYYTLEFVSSLYLLDISNGKTDDKNNVWQYEENGTDAQKWSIVELGDGKYNIISKKANKYLTNDNSNIVIDSKRSNNSQIFTFEKAPLGLVDDGIYCIKTNSGVLDIEKSSKNICANAKISDIDYDSFSQKIQIKYVGNEYYILKFMHSSKVLDVERAKVQDNTNVWQYNINLTDAQKWKISKLEDGSYSFISKSSGKFLTISNSNVVINSKSNNLVQNFELEKLSDINIVKEKTLDEGYYKIRVKNNKDNQEQNQDQEQNNTYKYLSVDNLSNDNKANVKIEENKDNDSQILYVKYLNDGCYELSFEHSSKYLDVSNGKPNELNNVWQYMQNGTDAQKWYLMQNDDGSFYIISKLEDKFLAVDDSNVCIFSFVDKMDNLKFYFEKVEMQDIEEGLYQIQIGGKVLDVNSSSCDNCANVIIYDKTSNANQKVIIKKCEDKFYTITFLHSYMALDVANGKGVNHNNVWQYMQNGTDAQKWKIRKNEDGTYSIISKLNNVYLSIANNNAKNCTNVEVQNQNNKNTQKFHLVKLDEIYSEEKIDDGIYQIKSVNQNGIIGSILDNVQLISSPNSNSNINVKITYQKDGSYQLMFLNSQKCLDVQNANTSNHANVWQYMPNNTPAQKWIIKKSGQYFEIISKLGKNLTIADDLNIEMLDANNKDNQKFKLEKIEMKRICGTYGISGLKACGNPNGSDLFYYKYGNGPNVLYLTFTVHGFEDNWYRDGQALTSIANDFFTKLENLNDYYIYSNWSVYVMPVVNPDGSNHGTTNYGPGRRTLYSMAPNHLGIDINRSFLSNGNTYKIYTDSRNYNGTAPYQAYEANYLKTFLEQNKSNTGANILIDLHGFEQSLIGNPDVLKYFESNFPDTTKKYNQYGNQYLISWARTNLGASSALVELPSYIKSQSLVESYNIYNKYSQSIFNLLKNYPINTSYIQAYSQNSEDIIEESEAKIAFDSLAKELNKEKNNELDNNLKFEDISNGIFIISNEEEILNRINKITNKKYKIENGYLKEDIETIETIESKASKETKETKKYNENKVIQNNKYDDFIEQLINNNDNNDNDNGNGNSKNKKYIISSNGYLYKKDILTGEIQKEEYEFLDKYQTYEYVYDDNCIFIDINTNNENIYNENEIFDTLIDLYNIGM